MKDLSQPNPLPANISRRKFVQRSVMAGAVTSLLPTVPAHAAAAASSTAPGKPVLFEDIGVRPLVNAKGTYTIISGSLSLPEVKAGDGRGRTPLRADG